VPPSQKYDKCNYGRNWRREDEPEIERLRDTPTGPEWDGSVDRERKEEEHKRQHARKTPREHGSRAVSLDVWFLRRRHDFYLDGNSTV
jgi:hypothetical protein